MAKDDNLAWLYSDKKPTGTHATPLPPTPKAPPPYIAPAPRPAANTPRTSAPQSSQPRTPASSSRPAVSGAPAPRQHRRRHPIRRGFRLLMLLLLVYVAFLIATPIIAWSRLTTIDNAPTGARPPEQPGTAILLVGSDARTGLTTQEATRLGLDTSTEGARTDTIMIMYAPVTGKSVLISLPRDSYVDIPGYGPNKINAAYALGGPKLLTATVEQATGLRIDGYAEVGFGGFATVVDAIGGVNLCPTTVIEAESSYPRIEPGCQEMDAKTSLWFVRSRHSDAQQDLGRVNRQRQFLSATLRKVISPATVLNPVRYWKVNMALTKGVSMGRDTSQGDALAMLGGMNSVSKDGLSFSVPIANPNATTAAGSSVLWDNAAASDLFALLARGDTSDLERFAKR